MHVGEWAGRQVCRQEYSKLIFHRSIKLSFKITGLNSIEQV
jgi:hypothetical protein